MTEAVTIEAGATAAATPSSRGRIEWLDAAKGIAIGLVVLGHVLSGAIDTHHSHNELALRYLFIAIYLFHMPLFFFLSGFLVNGRLVKGPNRFLTSLFTKIVYAYILWCLIQRAITYYAGSLVNWPVHQFWSVLKPMAIAPPPPYWFLYALFLMHLLSFALLRRTGPAALLAIGIGLKLASELVPLPYILTLTAAYLPYYLAGVYVGARPAATAWLAALRPRLIVPIALAVLAATTVVTILYYGDSVVRTGPAGWMQNLCLGFLGTPAAALMIAAVVAVGRLPRVEGGGPFPAMGRASMAIFVMHIIILGFARIILLRVLGPNAIDFLIPVLLALGVAAPMIAFEIAKRLRIAKPLALA